MDFTNVFFTNDLLLRLNHRQNVTIDKNFKHAENFLNDLILKNFEQFREELEKDIDIKYFPLSIELVLNEIGYRDRSVGYHNVIENRYELLEVNLMRERITDNKIVFETTNVTRESEIGIAHIQVMMRKFIKEINNDSYYFNEQVYDMFKNLLKNSNWSYLWPIIAAKSDKFTYWKEFKSVKELKKEFSKIISFFEDNLKTVVTQDFIG